MRDEEEAETGKERERQLERVDRSLSCLSLIRREKKHLGLQLAEADLTHLISVQEPKCCCAITM